MEESEEQSFEEEEIHTPAPEPGDKLVRSVWSGFRRDFKIDPRKVKKAELTQVMTRLVRNEKVKGTMLGDKKMTLTRGTPQYADAKIQAERFVTASGKPKGLWSKKFDVYTAIRETPPSTETWKKVGNVGIWRDNKGRILSWRKL